MLKFAKGIVIGLVLATTRGIIRMCSQVSAFAPLPRTTHLSRQSTAPSLLWESTAPEQEERSEIETFLAESYPSFYNLVLVNSVDVLKELRNPNKKFTIFAPNDQAFEALGDKKIQQLRDPRNLETTNKVAAFHCVVDDTEVVTAEAILDPNSNIGGVLTLAGEVPLGPSESGGFMGFGAKADGGIVVGPGAKIVQSVNGPRGVVHEVDGLVCPNLLWRYMDQLRLPGL